MPSSVVSTIIVVKTLTKKEAAVTFETAKVEKGKITNTVTATGTIEAITTVNVGTQVSGILQHVYVDFNQNVKQGQLLARLDETALRAQLEQSQSSVNQAQAQFNFQEATYKRLKVLYEKKLIAQADFDQAIFNYENSKAAVNNANSAFDRAQVNLDYATITSPIDGVVLNRAVEEGQTVAASFNTPTLFTIVNDLTQMEVQTSVDEADIGKVKQGQRVEFTVDAYSDMKFEGNVSEVRLQPVTTNNVVTYVVILSAPNPDKKLMPGMTASAVIYIEEKDNTLILPGKAIRFAPNAEYLLKMNNPDHSSVAGRNTAMAGVPDKGKEVYASVVGTNGESSGSAGPDQYKGESKQSINNVWLKDEIGRIKSVPIKTGINNGFNIEVLSGLKEGDEVIISMDDGSIIVPAVTQRRGLFGR